MLIKGAWGHKCYPYIGTNFQFPINLNNFPPRYLPRKLKTNVYQKPFDNNANYKFINKSHRLKTIQISTISKINVLI